MEHCAALHLVRSNVNISELLGDGGMLFNQNEYENVLLFAVGMKSEMLSEIMNITHVLHLIGGEALRTREVDLEFHTRLFNECTDVTLKKKYCDYICSLLVREQFRNKQIIKELPFRNVDNNGQLFDSKCRELKNLRGAAFTVETPNFNGEIYASFVKAMGAEGSLTLLQSANPSDISYRQGKPTMLALKDEIAVIVMTPLFLATLLALDVTEIPRLFIYWSHQNILKLTQAWKVSYLFPTSFP